MTKIIPKSIRGRSITKKVIPLVANLKKTLYYLKKSDWKYADLQYNYKKSYDHYKLDRVLEVLKINDEKKWPEIIKNNILNLYDEEIGINCADIYLIAYVCENYGTSNESLINFLKYNNVSDSLKTARNIRQVGKGDGIYLEILNLDGTVKDWIFFEKWLHMSENINNIFEQVVNAYEDVKLNEDKELLFYNMRKEQVDFEDVVTKSIIRQNNKYRTIYCIKEKSLEDISLRYIKKRIDKEFKIIYPDRHKIMKECFSIIDVIGELSDFVIYRYDFKDFFETVSSKEIYDKYLKKSNLKKYEMNILHKFVSDYDKCYAGIVISNSLIEIISRDFDLRIKAYFTKLGLIFYERYVDDGILIFNKYIEENEIAKYINQAIKETFQDSKVSLNDKKSIFISKNKDSKAEFNYLGYQFKKCKGNKGKVYFSYGINEIKIKKYENKMRNVILEYKRNENIELFRQRIQFLFSRVVFYNNFNLKYLNTGKWEVIGIVSNYCELRPFLKDDKKIIDRTKEFLKYSFINQVENLLGENKPYFLKGDGNEHYNLFNNLNYNKSIVFHPSIGWKWEHLMEKISMLRSRLYIDDKSYKELVKIYCSIIKL